jgi:beta-galactosidase
VIFTAKQRSFYLNKQPFFLYSGEIHYFRLKRELWATHLRKLKAAGATTVSTYIPWSWHEYAEGCFDFTGETNPQRDLVGFIKAAVDERLYMLVKPGPYILAEFQDRGIPAWLLKAHPQIKAEGLDMVTYLHPVFQEYVQKWYDAVLPLLAPYQISKGGPLIMMQVCNEVGLFNWLAGTADTSPTVRNYYHRYLRKQYQTIDKLNKAYRSNYPDFNEVAPPVNPASTSRELVRWRDWHDFHRWYYAEYLSRLIGQIRSRGIDLLLFHNIPGWVFGRGTEYPVNISFYAEIIQRHPELLFGIDHIPENPTYRNLHDDLIINELVRAVQGGQKPIWSAELQAGTREHNVRTFPNEMDLFYLACLARGMTGMNLYMFSQGQNPQGRGALGPTFYWETPLGTEATENQLYPVAQKLGQIIRTFGPALIQTEKPVQTGVLFYQPYFYDEFFYPVFGGVPKIDPAAVDLHYDPKTMRNTYFFDGFLRMMVLQNREFEFIDPKLTKVDPQIHRRLWVLALEYMDRETQAQLVNYVKEGGHLFIWPGLPDRDLNFNPCTLMKESFGLTEGTPRKMIPEEAKIALFELKDISVLSPIRVFEPERTIPGKTEKFAYTTDGACCGLTRRIGRGQVTLLGTCFGYNIAEHLTALEKLAALAPESSLVKLTNPELQYHLRLGKDYAFLFILNYTPVHQQTQVNLESLAANMGIKLPTVKTVSLPPVRGLIIPVHYPLGLHDASLLWTTGEVLKIDRQTERVEILVQPLHPDECELLFSSSSPPQVTIDGHPVAVQARDHYYALTLQGDREQLIVLAWQ